MRCTCLALALLVAPPLLAEERDQGRPISLHEALEVAVQQNPALEMERIDVEVASAQILAASGLDDLLLDTTIDWSSSRKEPVAGQFYQMTSSDSLSLSGGVTRPLSTGGSLSLRLGTDYSHSVTRVDYAGSIQDISTDIYAPSLALALTHPFLKGYGKGVARAARRRAEAAKDAATLDRENSAANTVRDLIHSYWELAYSVEELGIRRSSLALANEQLRIVRASIQAGRLAPTASAEVEAGIALREEEVLVAEQAVSERALELRRLAGLEIGPGEIDLVATDRLEAARIPESEPDLNQVLELAMRQNPQLLTLRAQGRSASIEVEVAENGLLPQLDFSASAGPSGYSEDASDAFEQLVIADSFSMKAGLVFSTTLGRRGARGALDAAKGNLRRVRFTETDVRAQIAVAVVRAANAVRSAMKRMEALVKSTEFAEVNLSAEKARFNVGRATNFDVLKRQDELAQAQVRQARAKTDYLKAVAVLEALTGEILPRHGISLATR